MGYKVNGKENIYFCIKVLFTIIVWLGIFSFFGNIGKGFDAVAASTFAIILVYAGIIILFFFFQKIFIVAFMKGEGVCVSERQFPEVYRLYASMAEKIGLRKIPPLFIIQQGGALNAFAIRFSRRNYIAVYSDVFAVHESDIDALTFVLGHELGHVRRHHMSKSFWTIPSAIIPFLSAAYSRACEYTCDNIGSSLTENNKANGLVLLAGGADLYKKIDVQSYLEDAKANKSATVKFAGLFMSHPYLPARIESIEKANA